jgi:hypothetical protein
VRRPCEAFGESCFQTDLEGECGLGACRDGETYACDGNDLISCIHGVRVRIPCGDGAHCGVNHASRLVGCWPTGAPCSVGARCDGRRAVNCDPDVAGDPREQATECADWGMGCAINKSGLYGPVAVCTPEFTTSSECGPSDKATCAGPRALRACVAGHWWTATCDELGVGGDCAPTAGFNGEAACQEE